MKTQKFNILAASISIMVAATASAEWTYDAGAKTLTSADGAIVLNNVNVWSGKLLTIGDNGYREDLTVLDFSDGLADGYSIRSLAGKDSNATKDSAFDNCPNLKTVITGDTLVDIGERAFEKCNALETVHIGKSCTSIGWGAFRQGTGPMVVTFAEGSALTTVGQVAFSGCTGLKSIDLSPCANLATIGNEAFKDCKSMTSFTLPENCKVSSFAAGTFQNCEALPSLDLSVCQNLTSIVEKSFLGCNKLALVKMPTSLTSLAKNAFDKHRSLAENNTPMLHVWFYGCPIADAKENPFGEMFGSTRDYTVTEEDMANASVTIHIPRAQATAGTPSWNTWAGQWQTLSDNSGVWNTDSTKTLFPLPATADGESLWVTDCRKTGVTWNDAAVKVVFWDDPNQIEISGPEYSGVFTGRDYTTASFTAQVKTYDTDSADYVRLVISLYTDDAHTSLAKSLSIDVALLGVVTPFEFADLTANTTYYATLSGTDSKGNEGDVIDLGSFTTKWDDTMWIYHSDRGTLEKGWMVVSNVTENAGALSIAANSNANDAELPELDFSCGIRDDYELVSIGASAFASCTSLTNVVLPETVTTVGNSAFRYDDALLSFSAPGPVTIGNECFYLNATITNAHLPNVVALNYRCFQACTALQTLGTDLSSLRSIGQEALSNCQSLPGDFVMTNLTSFGSWQFNGSGKITSVILGEGVNKIQTQSFASCVSLTNVVVQGELATLEGSAFSSHGPYNGKVTEPGHLNIYLTNVPDAIGGVPFSAQYWSSAMAGIDAETTTIVVHIPWYRDVEKGAAQAIDGTTDKFAAWARAWQKETLSSMVARGTKATTFELPATAKGFGQWRNDTAGASTDAYVVKLVYYTDPDKKPNGLVLTIW